MRKEAVGTKEVYYKATKYILVALLLGLTFIISTYSSSNYLDTDMLWHYVVGKDTVHSGPINANTYYTWQTNAGQWNQHEWLFDVILYGICNLFGAGGQCIIYGLITTLFVVLGIVIVKPKNPVLYIAFSMLFYMTVPLVRANRPIVLSLFLIALIPVIYNKQDINPWIKRISIFVMTVILANLHGGMLINVLAILFLIPAIHIFVDLFNPKPNRSDDKNKVDWGQLLLRWIKSFDCLLVAVIGSVFSPAGIHMIPDALRLGSVDTTKYISEWSPFATTYQAGVLLLFIVALFGYYVCKTSLRNSDNGTTRVILRQDVSNVALCCSYIVLSLHSAKAFQVAYAMLLFIGWPSLEIAMYDIFGAVTKKLNRYYDVLCVASMTIIFVLLVPFTNNITSMGTLNDWANSTTSVKIIDELKALETESEEPLRIGHGYLFGNSLVWNGIPCFVDSRQFMYDKDLTDGQNSSLNDLFHVTDEPDEGKVAAFIDKYEFEYIVTDASLDIDWYLRHDADWELIMKDTNVKTNEEYSLWKHVGIY